MSEAADRELARKLITAARAESHDDGPQDCADATDLQVAQWLILAMDELRMKYVREPVVEEAIASFVADIRNGALARAEREA